MDDADLYFQYTRSEGWSLEEGIGTGSFSIDQGVGVRAVSGERPALRIRMTFRWPRCWMPRAPCEPFRPWRRLAVYAYPPKDCHQPQPLPGRDPIASLDSTAKVALLERLEQRARAKDPRVAQVMAGLASEYDVVLVARADGTLAADVAPLVRLSITVIAEQNGRREVGSAGGGGRFGLAYFDDAQLSKYVDEAVNAALTNLESRPARLAK